MLLGYKDILHTTHIIILAGSGGTKGETDQVGRVQSPLQGNIKLNPLCKNTKVYCCAPMYRFITCRMADDSTSTLHAHSCNNMRLKFIVIITIKGVYNM